MDSNFADLYQRLAKLATKYGAKNWSFLAPGPGETTIPTATLTWPSMGCLWKTEVYSGGTQRTSPPC